MLKYSALGESGCSVTISDLIIEIPAFFDIATSIRR